MILDKITQGEEYVDRLRPAVPAEPRYLAERKHKEKLEKAALERYGGGQLAQNSGAVQGQPVTFTFDGGPGDKDQVCYH